ncbi:uncharacterized protein LOC128221150 isoform X1 [Mya arenaria]|uniref:uncharacterized protein LOC128221150 isoform X1 n=2 Tax=Mya arenaria TaxID=6604 RepID=UPI0022E79717|nr:uncharacterized protein LOC128221150 isoform X1 [Mya arenaria]
MLGLKCKCASNSQVHSGTCRRKCEEADQYPCGDTSDKTMFSIYTVEKVPPSSNSKDNNKNCLLFYYGYGGQGHNFYWSPCNYVASYPKILCSGTNYSDKNQLAKLYNGNNKWATAVDHCFVGKYFPATIQSIINAQFTNQNAQDYWTGIIKTESILSLSDKLDNSTNPPVTYAYVEQTNQTVYVRFANAGQSRKSLCTEDGTTATPSTTIRETQPTYSESTTAPVKPTTVSVGPSETNSITTQGKQPTYSEPTTTPVKSTTGPTSRVTSIIPLTSSGSDKTSDTPPTIKSTTTTVSSPVQEGKDQGGSTAGLAAGLSISFPLIFVVMVIVLLFLKRRGLLPNFCKHNDDKNNNTADTATEVSFVPTSTCESSTNTMQDLTASKHSYFVLEKTFEVTNKEEIDHYAEPDKSDVDYHDLNNPSQKDTDNNYDTIDGKKAPAESGLTKLNNNYNDVTLHQTNEYDHIPLNGRPTKDDKQTENEYDIKNNVIDGKHDTGFDDDSDTYNHLNNQDLKSSGTGEIYGMPNTDGDNDYDTSGSLKYIRNTATKFQQPENAVIKKKW